MRVLRSIVISGLTFVMAGCSAQAPITLRDMGSFHIGGREAVISGKPVKEVVFSPGGVPAKVDPNGVYQVEQMYVQYFLPLPQRGKVPILLWHGGGLTGVTYETTPDGREGWLNYFAKKGVERLQFGRGRARAIRLGHVSRNLQERTSFPDQGESF